MTVCVRVCVMNDEFIINDATWKNVIVCIYILQFTKAATIRQLSEAFLKQVKVRKV